jgi:hypothetical protein
MHIHRVVCYYVGKLCNQGTLYRHQIFAERLWQVASTVNVAPQFAV